MKVTQLIKEYVSKRVRENFPKTAEELAWEEKHKKVDDALTEANEKVEIYAKQIAKELNEKYGLLEGCFLRPYEGRCFISFSGRGEDKIYRAAMEAENERQVATNKAIEEILVSLEMGGTKADLEEMLAEIGE